MRSTVLVAAVVLLSLSSCGTDNSTQPSQTLEGVWNLVGYSDHGVSGVTTGSVRFGNDARFVVNGTVTYPGEPVDTLDISGTYQIVGKTVVLTTADDTGTWSVVFSGDQAVLALIGSVPPTTMTLEKQR
jgi:hypothetical protein